jgi:Domain of unknown function (DUF4178)
MSVEVPVRGLILVVLVALVVIAVVLVRRRPRRPPPAPPRDPFAAEALPGGDPRTIRAGDMIEYLGARYFVRGSLRLRQGGFTWSEHLLDPDEPGGPKVWVSVEEDPDLEVVWWTAREAGDARPDQDPLTVDEVRYRQEEHGTADYTGAGTTGLGERGRVEFVDYVGPGGRQVSFERFDGGPWEMGLGEVVPTATLTLYPGSDGR